VELENSIANSCESDKNPVVLKLAGLRQRLTDKARHDHFTVYVDGLIELRSRDMIGLLGPSGCGKTTLLTILGLLRAPSSTRDLELFDLHIPSLSDCESDSRWSRIDIKALWEKNKVEQIEKLRRNHFGFALQSGELLASLTVNENIAVPLRLNAWSGKKVDARVKELLRQFHLDRSKHGLAVSGNHGSESNIGSNGICFGNNRVNRLSGGEYQRVVLARAIAHKPAVVFVDEPTSALNRELAHQALTVVCDLQQNQDRPGITFMITHDEHLATEFCNVIVRMAPKRNEPAGEVVEVVRAGE
jgi:putative ABC transport system ATP-binding protein